ncbi:uncharacterized protein PAC_14560 [Phialocephala subalpina]|uniref:Nuclear pore protein n=1 Tax=Phialocephala subalpina TaxID=576137 RepID=A0A1L7XI07_9HELO|nr:uncharacterized protein PAC_14560 [Phialocephala subalpina]
MCLASKVWKKFIYPPWAPSQQTLSVIERLTAPKPALCAPPVDKLDFREDDGDALLLLLRVAHIQFKHIKSTLSSDLLHGVAELCDIYGCVELIKPWLSTWWDNSNIQFGRGEFAYRWLFAAWVFGFDRVFATTAKAIAWVIDADGNVPYGGAGVQVSLKTEKLPPGILDNILEARQNAIEKILETPKSRVAQLTYSSRKMCLRNPCCDDIFLGSLIRTLASLDLLTTESLIPDASQWARSANDLFQAISGLPRWPKQVSKLCWTLARGTPVLT